MPLLLELCVHAVRLHGLTPEAAAMLPRELVATIQTLEREGPRQTLLLGWATLV